MARDSQPIPIIIIINSPMCLFAMMCPQAILAQLHWKLNEDRPSYALFGYYFILVFITGCMVFVGTFPNAAVGVGQVNFLFMTIVLLSLYKKARDLGNIRGNYYASLCGKSCCPDACADTFDVFGFPCLALARLGHHVFNYNHNESPNGAITYEPIDVEFELVRECDPVREAANNTGIEKV